MLKHLFLKTLKSQLKTIIRSLPIDMVFEEAYNFCSTMCFPNCLWI